MTGVLFAAGGTGGHLFPAIEIADELTEAGVQCFFAAHGLTSSQFFPQGKWGAWDIHATRPSLHPVKASSFFWNTACSTREACKLIDTLQPKCVVGFGSFHTVPVLLATVLKKVPLFLFEPNVAPGKVIRLFARYAQTTGVCFEAAQEALKAPSVLVAMALLRGNIAPVDREVALRRYELSGDKPIVVAFGGSQGAAVINQTIIQALHLFDRQKRPHLLLLCGKQQDKEALEKMAMNLGVIARVIPFESEMSHAYAVADVVVCRSGASTIAELLALKKLAICIPYPHAADRHQQINAQELAKTGRAVVVHEDVLTPDMLCTEVFRFLQRLSREGGKAATSQTPVRGHFSKILLDWMG